MSQATINSPSTFSESYTSSSKLSENLPEREYEDLTKDNVASPIDLECNIQEERITKLLDDLIFKSKISIALPKLMEDVGFLATVLSPSDFGDIVFIYQQYDNPLFSGSMVDLGAIEDIKEGDISLKNRLNPELGHLLYIFNGCSKLREPIEAIINEMRTGYISHMTRPPNPPLEFLLVMEHFRNLMYAQMNGSAADELAAKLKVRKLESSNARLIADIKEFTAKIKSENDHFVKTIAEKTNLIDKLQEEVAFNGLEASSRRKKQILDSDRQMVLMSRAHHNKYEMLQEEHVDVIDRYETVLARHMQDEKAQRLRRCKVETQLQSWLQKYDLEMSEKQVEMDDYMVLFDEEEEKVKDLEERLEEQNKDYIPLMEEREKEYHQELTNKMDSFQKEHAARVIQFAWRNVLLNRAEKKKLKKLLAKKIAADQAAEAAMARAAAQAAKQAALAAKAAKKAEKQAAKEAKRAAKEKQLAEEAAAAAAKKGKK